MTTPQTRRQHPWIGFVIAFLLVGAWTATVRAQARDRNSGQLERSTQTLRLDPGGLLDLSNVSGDITVRGDSGREVILEITKRASRIEERTRYPRNNRRTRISVSYDVTVPRDARVALRSVSGDLILSDVDGEVRVETVSGEVEVRRVAQLVRAKSMSGDVSLADIAADGRLEASTVSGDLAVDERCSFNAHSGNVRLILSEEVGFELEASSFSGSVRSDLPVVLDGFDSGSTGRRRNRNVVGTYGDGRAFLEISTFSGDIVIAR